MRFFRIEWDGDTGCGIRLSHPVSPSRSIRKKFLNISAFRDTVFLLQFHIKQKQKGSLRAKTRSDRDEPGRESSGFIPASHGIPSQSHKSGSVCIGRRIPGKNRKVRSCVPGKPRKNFVKFIDRIRKINYIIF